MGCGPYVSGREENYYSGGRVRGKMGGFGLAWRSCGRHSSFSLNQRGGESHFERPARKRGYELLFREGFENRNIETLVSEAARLVKLEIDEEIVSRLFMESAVKREPNRDVRGAHQGQQAPPPGQGI